MSSAVGGRTTVTESRAFTADPLPGTYPVQFAAFGDMGTAMPFGFKVTQKIDADRKAAMAAGAGGIAFVFHHGDISCEDRLHTAPPPPVDLAL